MAESAKEQAERLRKDAETYRGAGLRNVAAAAERMAARIERQQNR